jgi:shikimate dehydrogenase
LNKTPDRYAVIGHPVAHSRSPQIHAEFARLTGQAVHYERIDIEPEHFTTALREFLRSGGRGLNVTLPFKEEAYALCHLHTPRAERARCVNTLYIKDDNTLVGDNTDGAGLVADLRRNQQITIQGSRVLILGAGGAARGILPALLDEAPASIRIANRTPKRARHLAGSFSSEGRVSGSGLDELSGLSFDIVINATSASLKGELPPLPDDLLEPGAVCYDLAYAERPSLFMHWAEREGAALILDGWGMLVEQAAESFFIWRGVRPSTATLLALHPH